MCRNYRSRQERNKNQTSSELSTIEADCNAAKPIEQALEELVDLFNTSSTRRDRYKEIVPQFKTRELLWPLEVKKYLEWSCYSAI